MIQAISHLVIATQNVARQARFFQTIFSVFPNFQNDQFCEFILPDRFRVAFFKPVGKSAKVFRSKSKRDAVAYGVTVRQVDDCYGLVKAKARQLKLKTQGPPKDHPWGERSFLLIDPDGNRWEIAQSPSDDGKLVPKEFV